MPIRPMKGVSIDAKNINKMRFPYMASYKLDGIRGIIDKGVAYSNSGKPLPSPEIQNRARAMPDGLDGEWVYGDPREPDCHRKTSSAVMSKVFPDNLEKCKLVFYVFDYVTSSMAYSYSYDKAKSIAESFPLCRVVERILVTDKEYLDTLYSSSLRQGYEGLVLRSPASRYKQGRATANENSFWKMKPFGNERFEAEILGWYPLQVNVGGNSTDAFGYATTSSRADCKATVESLGGFVVRDLKSDVVFKIGGGQGLTQQLRNELYLVGDDLLGRVLQYTCMTYGVKEKPRHPQFAGFRDRIDLTEY